MSQKLKTIVFVFAAILALTLVWLPQHSFAAAGDPGDNSTSDPCHPENWTPKGVALTPKQLASCQACNQPSSSVDAQAQVCLKNNGITKDLNIIVDALSGLVGVVSVAMIIVGGIQYSLARNNPQAISSARSRIINALLALVAFMFIWAFLQYIIPGGAF